MALATREAHGPHGDHAHDHDQRVDRVGVEEPADAGTAAARAPAGHAAIVIRELAPRADGRRRRGHRLPRGSGASRTSTNTGIANSPNSTAASRNRASTGTSREEDQQAHEDRPAVPDPRPEPAEPAARLGRADELDRGVVVDQRRLVGEVRDDEQDRAQRPAPPSPISAVGTMHATVNASRNGSRAAAPVRDRAEDRRDDGVERRRSTTTAMASTAWPVASPNRVVGQPQAHRPRHDRRTRRSCSRSRTASRRTARPAAGCGIGSGDAVLGCDGRLHAAHGPRAGGASLPRIIRARAAAEPVRSRSWPSTPTLLEHRRRLAAPAARPPRSRRTSARPSWSRTGWASGCSRSSAAARPCSCTRARRSRCRASCRRPCSSRSPRSTR